MTGFRLRLQHAVFRVRSSRTNLSVHGIKQHTRQYASTIKDGSVKDTKNASYKLRLRRMNDKLPRFLRHYTTPLLSAPVSHITAFLVLHEITALVPLVGLATFFHYANWLPEQVVNGPWVQAGVEKWGRYFQKKGWAEQQQGALSASTIPKSLVTDQSDGDVSVGEIRSRGAGWNVVLEVATAWAVVKALLPVRIVGSVWLTPWFARIAVVPLMRIFGKAGKTLG